MFFFPRALEHPKARERLDEWGLQVSTELVAVPAQVLPHQQIVLGNRTVNADRDWGRALEGGLLNPVSSKNLITREFRTWMRLWSIFPVREESSSSNPNFTRPDGRKEEKIWKSLILSPCILTRITQFLENRISEFLLQAFERTQFQISCD
jgi:hypothetical protein